MDEQEKEIEEIKQNTKDKLSQAKAGISPPHAKPQ